MSSSERSTIYLFHEGEEESWYQIKTWSDHQQVTDILSALGVRWDRQPDPQSRNIRVMLAASVTREVLTPWVEVRHLREV